MPTVRVISGPAAGTSLEIKGEITVGREGGDLEISDSEMSRRHATLRLVPGGVEIEDLGSLNGTYVNGERIAGRAMLAGAGTVRLGTSELAVEVAGAPVAAPDVTKARDVVAGSPDVTKARDVVAGSPDVTKARDVVAGSPDVTKARPISAAPDDSPSQPSPDVTVVRPTAPSAGEKAPLASPPPPSEAARGTTRAGGRRRLIGAAAALIAVAAIAVLILLLLS